VDPSWDGDPFDPNPFVFAIANPIRFWDPDGKD
jgi:hypothetical protein